MKIRGFARALVFITAIIVLWCTVSLDGASFIGNGVRIALTVLVVFLCYFIEPKTLSRITDGLSLAISRLCDCIMKAIRWLGRSFRDGVPAFVEKCCETKLEDARRARSRIMYPYYDDKTERAQARRPVRRVCRRLDFTSVMLCTWSILALAACVMYVNFWAFLLMLALTAAGYYVLRTVMLSLTYSPFFGDNDPNTPFICTWAVVVNVLVAFFELLGMFCVMVEGIEAMGGLPSEYLPKYEIQFSIGRFTLSPAVMWVLAFAILTVVGYCASCVAVHDMAHTDKADTSTQN